MEERRNFVCVRDAFSVHVPSDGVFKAYLNFYVHSWSQKLNTVWEKGKFREYVYTNASYRGSLEFLFQLGVSFDKDSVRFRNLERIDYRLGIQVLEHKDWKEAGEEGIIDR